MSKNKPDEWKNHTHLYGHQVGDYIPRVGTAIGDDPETHYHVTMVGPSSPPRYEEDGAHTHATAIGPTGLDQPTQKGAGDGVSGIPSA